MEVIDLEDGFGGPWGWFVKGWHNKREFLSQVEAHLEAQLGEDAEGLLVGAAKDSVEHMYARWVAQSCERIVFTRAAGPGRGAFQATLLEAL
jgi:hypothetical protein